MRLLPRGRRQASNPPVVAQHQEHRREATGNKNLTEVLLAVDASIGPTSPSQDILAQGLPPAHATKLQFCT